jgi:nitrogen regulatory protein PII
VEFIAKTRIEVVVADDLVDRAIKTIVEHTKTGKIGDGKIFVSTVEQTIRIRTGETGPDAL